jgi:hypothetical protein
MKKFQLIFSNTAPIFPQTQTKVIWISLTENFQAKNLQRLQAETAKAGYLWTLQQYNLI